jgi:3-hydroxyacyl-[acyl-carrier-protein] dehydratase
MRFQFLDEVVDSTPERIVAIRRIREDEPALADHFPTFPILPGVLMLETMIQAARRLLAQSDPEGDRAVLSEVRAIKYGAMLKPGMTLRVSVEVRGRGEGGAVEFKGTGRAIGAGDDPKAEPDGAPTAVSGRFTLRPINVSAPTPG